MKKSFPELIKSDRARIIAYFQSGEREITRKNLGMLEALSLLIAFLLLLFFLITPIILPHWEITPQHILFLPATLIFYIPGVYYQRKAEVSSRSVTLLSIGFITVLFFFVALIDILPAADAPGCFMPYLCVAIPVLFILRPALSLTLFFLFTVIYIVMAAMLKDPFIARYDIFDAVVAYFFSIPISLLILRLRIQDHELSMKYQQLSTRDGLSGILNKAGCTEAAERYLQLHRPEVSCALLVLDIDDFKHVNDTYGHFTGDAILQEVGNQLLKAFRSSDIVGRFGGDEFLVLVKDTCDQYMLSEKCRILQENLYLQTGSVCKVPITCSIGGSIIASGDASFSDLFRQADSALYAAKAAGKNRYYLHTYFPE